MLQDTRIYFGINKVCTYLSIYPKVKSSTSYFNLDSAIVGFLLDNTSG